MVCLMPKKPRVHKMNSPGRLHKNPYDPDRATKIRSTYRWQRIRSQVRRRNPLCADPFGDHEGIPVATQEIHHIKSLNQFPELAFDLENLQGLCIDCHQKIDHIRGRGIGA